VSSVIARAEEIANQIAVDGVMATCDITRIGSSVPGVLVVPAPTLTPSGLCDSADASWTIVVLAKQPANLVNTGKLLELVQHVWDTLDYTIRFEPDAYQLGDLSLPAYVGRYEEQIDL
jgi:hypothetical protein